MKTDQYEAAVAEARQIIQRERIRTFAFEPDREDTPAVVKEWMQRYAENLDRLRKCPHGDLSRVHVIFGSEPNRAYCVRQCLEPRARQLLRSALARRSMDCDFCGRHYPADELFPLVFNVAAVVVRAAACARCAS